MRVYKNNIVPLFKPQWKVIWLFETGISCVLPKDIDPKRTQSELAAKILSVMFDNYEKFREINNDDQ